MCVCYAEMRMYRLLIVDRDEDGTGDARRRELQAEGFSVEVVSDPGEAASRVKDSHPHLVILDLCMPRGEGIS